MSRNISRRNLLGNAAALAAAAPLSGAADAAPFRGRHFRGEGASDWLSLLETAYAMLEPHPELQNLSMLYSPAWNGFVEGPTWGAWWIQNSYGPTYCGLPFFLEPYPTFLQNAQDLWFMQMGDGKRKGANDWVAPDGCLCDAASPNWIVYKQGDGRTDIHDWGVEFTAAGIVLQAELLLIARDLAAVRRYLPMLERSADFIETRRDPANDLFLAGPAGNLLAPSYAGCRKPDGTYGMAYLAGLSVTYIAALDRLIELNRLASRPGRAEVHADRRRRAAAGLARLQTPEGYLVKYIDPDGTRHGVFGAPRHGYFEAVCNHDAVALRVVDEPASRRIMDRMLAIPGLRPHGLIITNAPSLDDMYTSPEGLWKFGTWVNGGHWTTCEARMIVAYMRMGRHSEARRAFEKILEYARSFRMDNPLVEFGGAVYQPGEPINCTYDAWGAPLGLLRGLFEYVYGADRLVLYPHLPDGVTCLEQRFPVRWGPKRLYIRAEGAGPVRSVYVNGRASRAFDESSVRLDFAALPATAWIDIRLGAVGKAGARGWVRSQPRPVPALTDAFWDPSDLVRHPIDNGRPLRIGADSNGEHRFVGRISAVRLWSRALAPEEVARLGSDRSAVPEDRRGLVAQWDCGAADAGSDLADAVGGRPLRRVGKVGPGNGAEGLEMDGEGYLEAPLDPVLALSDALTLEAWIRPTSAPNGGMRIIDKITAGIDDAYLLDTYPAGALRCITRLGSASHAEALSLGQWSHVAATCDPKTGMCLYVNGRPVAKSPAKPAADSPSLPRIGAFYAALCGAGLEATYEARHARLVVDTVQAMHERAGLRDRGKLPKLAPASQLAADRSYLEAARRLAEGLARTVEGYARSKDAGKARVLRLWRSTQ